MANQKAVSTNENSVADEINKQPMQYYLKPLDGNQPFSTLGMTVDGQSSFTQSTTSTTYDTEQQKKVIQSIDSVERNLNLSSLYTTIENLKIAFLDAVIQSGVLYFGKKGTIKAQEYSLMAISVNADENGEYTCFFLRRVTCDGNTTINFNQTEYQNVPLNFIILNDETVDQGSAGIIFKSDINKPNDIVIPVLSDPEPLLLKSINPADGNNTVTTDSKIQVIYSKPVRYFGTQTFAKVDSGNKSTIKITAAQQGTVKGIAQTGSTMTSLIHDGVAYPASAFVNSKVRILLTGNINASVTTTITAYNAGTKTFTLTASGITQDISGMQFEILSGYAVYTPDAALEASTTYEFATANERDDNDTVITPIVNTSRFTTAAAARAARSSETA